jgi:hypothetical protein
VRITAGAEHVGMFQNHPPLSFVEVFAATLPSSLGVHINYAETVLPMRDGLPKFKDFSAEFGSSGICYREHYRRPGPATGG